MIRKSLVVSGFVQGVGFRYHTNLKAVQHEVTGYVRNLENGDVLIEVQGEEENVQSFIMNLDKSLLFAKIDNIDEEIVDPIEGEKGFKVRY